MFRWALSQDLVETDPTAGLEAYDRGMPRDRVLTVEEIETVWKWLDSDALSLEAADILKLELLTGARCGEISGLRAEEIDRNKWIWTLPAQRSKNGRQRVTPIVGLAREILEQRLSGVEKGPLFLLEKGVVVTSAHIGHYLLTRRTTLPIAVFTSHDLRRTFATMLAEMGMRSILLQQSLVMSWAARTPGRWCATTCTPTCLSGRRMRLRLGTTGSRAL